MHLSLIVIGKTDDREIDSLIQRYADRLGHYLPFNLQVIPDVKRSKGLSAELQKRTEGQALLALLQPTDRLILFDERGREYTSREFAGYIQQAMVSGEKRLVFAIGGPYGFSPEVYARAQGQVSLSRMTFSHQMVRLFAVEQLYRAQTILQGTPYHHD